MREDERREPGFHAGAVGDRRYSRSRETAAQPGVLVRARNFQVLSPDTAGDVDYICICAFLAPGPVGDQWR